MPAEASLDEIDLNGAPGLVVRARGRPVVAILIDTDGERIRSVFAVANPDKLDALARGIVPPGRPSQADSGKIGR